MALVTPTRSFLAGLLLLVPVHLAPRILGGTYGISGALHRSASPQRAERSWPALTGTAGLLAGGALLGWLLPTQSAAESVALGTGDWLRWALCGLLVGAGSKLANGCTSGHMLSGLTRLSPRSLVATALFFVFGGLAASLAPSSSLPAAGSLVWDWSLGKQSVPLIIAALASFAAAFFAHRLLRRPSADTAAAPAFLLSAGFALALALSGMLDAPTILSFLSPFSASKAWNPSLLFLAAVLPLSVAFYTGPKLARDKDWREARLWAGAALFGVGWGLSGVCPGPGVVNLGRAVVQDAGEVARWAAWVVASVLGGRLAQAVWRG